MHTVLITGGTGLIGTALSRRLIREGYNVIILSRNPAATAASFDEEHDRPIFSSRGKMFYARWDIRKMTIDAAAMQEADYVIHLAGAGVADRRWTEARKQEIRDSRTRSSELLVNSLATHSNKVKAVISASAIGWYGPDNGRPFTETDPPSTDFLGETCRLWEQSIDPVAAQLGKRLVKLRAGIVLSKEGGALHEFRKPIFFGVAAVLGDGSQMTSWVHINDLCSAFIYAIEHEEIRGVYNVTAPAPVTHRDLTLTLAKAMRGKFYLPIRVPTSLLQTALGEMSVEVLKSATVESRKIQDAGFQFRFPEIEAAVKDLVG